MQLRSRIHLLIALFLPLLWSDSAAWAQALHGEPTETDSRTNDPAEEIAALQDVTLPLVTADDLLSDPTLIPEKRETILDYFKRASVDEKGRLGKRLIEEIEKRKEDSDEKKNLIGLLADLYAEDPSSLSLEDSSLEVLGDLKKQLKKKSTEVSVWLSDDKIRRDHGKMKPSRKSKTRRKEFENEKEKIDVALTLVKKAERLKREAQLAQARKKAGQNAERFVDLSNDERAEMLRQSASFEEKRQMLHAVQRLWKNAEWALRMKEREKAESGKTHADELNREVAAARKRVEQLDKAWNEINETIYPSVIASWNRGARMKRSYDSELMQAIAQLPAEMVEKLRQKEQSAKADEGQLQVLTNDVANELKAKAAEGLPAKIRASFLANYTPKAQLDENGAPILETLEFFPNDKTQAKQWEIALSSAVTRYTSRDDNISWYFPKEDAEFTPPVTATESLGFEMVRQSGRKGVGFFNLVHTDSGPDGLRKDHSFEMAAVAIITAGGSLKLQAMGTALKSAAIGSLAGAGLADVRQRTVIADAKARGITPPKYDPSETATAALLGAGMAPLFTGFTFLAKPVASLGVGAGLFSAKQQLDQGNTRTALLDAATSIGALAVAKAVHAVNGGASTASPSSIGPKPNQISAALQKARERATALGNGPTKDRWGEGKFVEVDHTVISKRDGQLEYRLPPEIDQNLVFPQSPSGIPMRVPKTEGRLLTVEGDYVPAKNESVMQSGNAVLKAFTEGANGNNMAEALGSATSQARYRSLHVNVENPRVSNALNSIVEAGAKLKGDEKTRAMIDSINRKIFPKDTWYTKKKTEPTFDEMMRTRPGEPPSIRMQELICAGQADCRGRNLMLAQAMVDSGEYEDVRIINRWVNTRSDSRVAYEQHTMVLYREKGAANTFENWKVADAYFRQFNGRWKDFQTVTGVRSPGGRWNDPEGSTPVTAWITPRRVDRPVYLFGRDSVGSQ